MIPPKCMPPRKKCAATTREAILGAARARFLGESYDTVGLRDIARDAGVDVALVSRYFGSKEELFRLVLKGGDDNAVELPTDPRALPAFFQSLCDQGEDAACTHKRDKLMIMLRSASSAAAGEVILASFRKDVLQPLADVIGGQEATARAVLTMSVLIGTNFLRNILSVEPLAGEDEAAFRAGLLRLLETALSAPPVSADAVP
jgi:AcrR family transcriptional regulator